MKTNTEPTATMYQAVQNGVVVFENLSRSLVVSYMIQHQLPGRPTETQVPYAEAYPELDPVTRDYPAIDEPETVEA